MAKYVVIIDRPGEEDYGPHDTDEAAIAQLVRELQGGWDETGIGGFFRVVARFE